MSDFYKTCACRQTGILHTLKHRPCEDHTAMSVSPDGCIAITLADGAGSYSKAAEGAQITSTAAAEHLANHFTALWQMPPDQAAYSILDAVLCKLSAEAGSTGLSLKEYSSTLLAAAAAPDGRCLLFHVGDGVILGLDRSGCHILSRYEHDGPDNLTTFVTVPGTTYFIQQSNMHQSGLCAYALMSDGCEEKMVNEFGCDPHAQLMLHLFFFLGSADMANQLESLFQLMQSHGATDDLSINLLADTRCTGDIFSAVSPAFRRDILELPAAGYQVKRLSKVLHAVAHHPEGMTFHQLSLALHLHSARIAKRKAMRLVDAGLLTLSDGVLRIV